MLIGEKMKKWNLLALVFVLSALFCLTGNGTAHSGGTMIDLGTLGGPGSQARSINDSGQIVGLSFTASGQIHAFLYSGEKMTDLGTLPGGTYSYAYGINNNGQIVGYSRTPSGQDHAFLYNPEPDAVLSANPTSLSPSCVKGRNAASQNFTIQNNGAVP